MLRVAAEAGTTDIVATPHADIEYKFEPEVVAEKLAELAASAAVRPNLHTGCDFHLMFDNIQDALANPTKYTINHKRYLLVEFSDLQIFPSTAEIFSRMLDAGMIPIVTHPERNALLRQRLGHLEEWVRMGCRLQVTGQSLAGRFGNRAADFSRMLLDKNLVHFLASDSHDAVKRPPRLDGTFHWVSRRYGPEAARALCIENPRAALTGDPLPAEPAPPARRKWYRFW